MPGKRKNSTSEASPAKRAKTTEGIPTWRDIHADLEADKKIGHYGGCNTAYHAMAEAKENADLNEIQRKRTKDENLLPEMVKLLENPRTQARWEKIVAIDPMGMWATRPTISGTYACMSIPELYGKLERDGKIVKDDDSIAIIKMAVDGVWNLPGIAARVGLKEELIREKLYKYSDNPNVKNNDLKAFLPPIGGVTVYIIGDPAKLADPKTEVAVRVHDECSGSDTFGTDICTCRPYLVFAIQHAVECAQRGGVGVICYFRKEGRALGEVTKFRVYNARRAQDGGDRPEMYFQQTLSIAGVIDARIQELMPDVLLWLGIDRIDWLMSMSSEKYEAIIAQNISVLQRISLPDDMVPKNANVEIMAKVASGYHTSSLIKEEVVSNLSDLATVRNQANRIFEFVEAGKGIHFTLDMSKLPKVADFVVKTIKDTYPNLNIPPHSRLRHFMSASGTDVLKGVRESWKCDEAEKTRRVIDLVFVSVLLDAGAGEDWSYTSEDGEVYTRSEGLALASLDMLRAGLFSSDDAVPHRVNSLGLRRLTLKQLITGFQVTKSNPMVGLEGRYGLLQRLAEAMESKPEFFGYELCRPGNLLDYVQRYTKDGKVSLRVLWKAIIEGLADIWPATMSGVRRGDVWTYTPLLVKGQAGTDLVPFHKLSQWLTYSLVEVLEGHGLVINDLELLTALAEYRNGGLFVDMGVLVPKDKEVYSHVFDAGSELVIEWRALTLVLVDKVAVEIRKKLKKELPLAQILEGGTWRAGRIIAKELRKDGSPPIQIRSSGTVF